MVPLRPRELAEECYRLRSALIARAELEHGVPSALLEDVAATLYSDGLDANRLTAVVCVAYELELVERRN